MNAIDCIKDDRFRQPIDADVLDIFNDKVEIKVANEGLDIIEPIEDETVEVDVKPCDDKCKDKKCKCKKHGDKYNIEININDNEIDPKAKNGGEVEVELESKDVCPECGKAPCECKESKTESNMSYCRFYNTLDDLKDCYSALANNDIESEEEFRKAKQLIDLCKQIAADYEDYELDPADFGLDADECLKNTQYRKVIDKDILDILGEIDTTIANEGKQNDK